MNTNPITPPTLAEGERYIGAITTADGVTTQIILLPGSTRNTWNKSIAWAASIGGDLPSRVEQALLFATAKEEFEPECYWSNTSTESGWAWYHLFDDGYQDTIRKSIELRARAVRKLIIQ